MRNTALCLITLAAALCGQDDDFDRDRLEAEFVRTLSGCRMVGVYTTTGSDSPPARDSYTIAKVEKIRDDLWRFHARIEYRDKPVTLPVAARVKWAGDTPMIQLTDAGLPGLGTFSARVLIYRGEYAGTWSGGDHGGHMYGRIVPLDEEPVAANRDGESALHWANWRGPTGNGVAPDANPPLKFGPDRNLAWRTELPGLGNSTPIVVGDRLYLSTAAPRDDAAAEAPAPEPEQGGRRRGRGRATPQVEQSFRVLAIDRADGSIVWEREVITATPAEGLHATNSHASASPVSDGEHVYAFFGSHGLYCLDLDGEVVWSKDFGQMRTRNEFGEGSSPALFGDTLVVNWDHEGDSFVVALDKATGDERWRKSRDEVTSWSTPRILEVDGRPQVVISATGASRGYDLATGDVIWQLAGMTTNCIPSPLYADGVVYLASGFRGNAVQAVRLAGAAGDLAGSDHVVWERSNNAPYTPSPLLYQGRLWFFRSNTGVLSCVDAKTGEVHFEGEKTGLRTVYASPLGAAGRVYAASREGQVLVLDSADEFRVLAEVSLDDGFDASPVAVDTQLFLRGQRALWCFASGD